MVEKPNVRTRRMNDGISQTGSECNKRKQTSLAEKYNRKSYNKKKVTVILSWWRGFFYKQTTLIINPLNREKHFDRKGKHSQRISREIA